jgi:hypothetical protein
MDSAEGLTSCDERHRLRAEIERLQDRIEGLTAIILMIETTIVRYKIMVDPTEETPPDESSTHSPGD